MLVVTDARAGTVRIPFRNKDFSDGTPVRSKTLSTRSTWSSASRRRRARRLLAVLLVLPVPTALGAGTEAGRAVVNRVELAYRTSGSAGEQRAATELRTAVDELLDVAVVLADSTPVPVSSPQTGAILEFLVTNTGNGTERFRLLTRDAVSGDDFDPNVQTMYLETNALPGLQIGAGGDTEYVPSANDPELAPDAALTVYVASTIPAGVSAGGQGAAELRAVAVTIVAATGADDPAAPAFPAPGTAFAGLGDAADDGGNVTAVVGTAHDPARLLLRTQGRYEVGDAALALAKTATAVRDPEGGSTVVTGAVITYEIAVTVSGSGTAEGVRVQDALPVELEYVPGTLSVSALPPGEEIDDDFLPAGTDNTGYDAASRTISVGLGALPGGSSVVAIVFQAIVQ